MARHELDYEPNICCEMCNDCYACDFDCPACGEQTRIWGDVVDSVGQTIDCDSAKCKAKFIVASGCPFVLVDIEK